MAKIQFYNPNSINSHQAISNRTKIGASRQTSVESLDEQQRNQNRQTYASYLQDCSAQRETNYSDCRVVQVSYENIESNRMKPNNTGRQRKRQLKFNR